MSLSVLSYSLANSHGYKTNFELGVSFDFDLVLDFFRVRDRYRIAAVCDVILLTIAALQIN